MVKPSSACRVGLRTKLWFFEETNRKALVVLSISDDMITIIMCNVFFFLLELLL